jgi:mRNA interferase MazF
MSLPDILAGRGEIWEVRFDPSEGDEIRKVRPAAVINVKGAGRMRLSIVVPITGWQSQFMDYSWMTRLIPDSGNGLTKESAADAFQVKSLSVRRFQEKIGSLDADTLDEIAAAVAWCVGYNP